MVRVLPQAMYENNAIHKILRDGQSCVLYKEIGQTTLNKEGYVSTHALTLVLQGKLQIEKHGCGTETVNEGQMIIVPKGLYMISDCLLPNNEPFVAMVFFFDEALIDSFIASLGKRKYEPALVHCLVMNCSDPIRWYTDNLLKLYKEGSSIHNSITRAKLFELLHLLSISPRGEEFIRAILSLKNQEKRSIREFMLSNFSKPLTVEDYAYLTGRSLSTFVRDFKRLFQISPKQWLMEQRLEKARKLLSINNTSVSDVAYDSGYENISHFIKAFHKKFNISPKQYLIQKRNEVLV
jgi:AraC family transcriptional regulator, exoenzyme S synthesis regulatory protein ExsA